MFERYDQKVDVFAFYGCFMNYCPQFLGSRAISNNRKARYMFGRYDQKVDVFAFYGLFMSYCPQYLC